VPRDDKRRKGPPNAGAEVPREKVEMPLIDG
jgi:hypothetical protein